MRDVNKEQLLEHVVNMINTLEYDSMRSPGKTKFNCQTLAALYDLKDRYEADLGMVEVPKVVVEEVPVKRGPGRPPAKKD